MALKGGLMVVPFITDFLPRMPLLQALLLSGCVRSNHAATSSVNGETNRGPRSHGRARIGWAHETLCPDAPRVTSAISDV
jgi:hypothetical protein